MPDAPDPTEGEFVSDYLLYLLAAASEEASAQFHKTVRDQGLRVPEWRVLACLQDRDGAMITQLARFALVEQSRLTRIILQMDTRGLVSRRSDPEDGRRVRIFLTQKGHDLAQSLVTQARAHEAKLLDLLPGADSARLKPALRQMLSTLQSNGA
ncbi:MAG: MarR family winged helix-turn-helix transcriptional regulator [Sedimentitalea sp.]